MSKLKLGLVETDKDVRMSIRLSPQTYRNVLAYAEALSKETGQPPPKPERLLPVMAEHFMTNDRGFAKLRRSIARADE